MLAKLAPGNQLTLPDKAMDMLGHPLCFEVSVEGNRLVLTPCFELAAVQDHIAALGITEQDIADAVTWARSQE